MSLDNTISTPLFQQLAETLRAAIDAGEYPPGSRLPTENELCERYSVSRVTVRKALENFWCASPARARLLRKRRSSESWMAC